MYNILICDDQPDIVDAQKIYLAPESYTLFEAFNGQEVLDILKEKEIHLILHIPTMRCSDILELMQNLKKVFVHSKLAETVCTAG